MPKQPPKQPPSEQELMELLQMIQGQMMPGLNDLTFEDPAFEDPDELRRNIAELPRRSDMAWLGFIEMLDAAELRLPPGVTPYLVTLLRPEGPHASLTEVAEDREEAELMLLQEMLESEAVNVEDYRPGILYVPDTQQAFGLGNLLRDTGIAVEVEPTGELAQMRDQLLSEFSKQASEHAAMMQPQPMLTGLSDEQVTDFVRAFEQFIRADGWEVVKPDKPISATWTDSAGQQRTIYATAMGDMGESFGLAFFEDWLAYAEQINNSYSQELVISGLDGMEAVTAGDQSEYTPEDWARLEALGLTDTALTDTALPSLSRLNLEGTMPTRTPIPVVTAVLKVLADRAQRKPGVWATSLSGEYQGVSVRYPGKPADELRPQDLEGTVTLTFSGGPYLPSGQQLLLSGPSGETMTKLRLEVKKQMENGRKGNGSGFVPDDLTRPITMTEDGDEIMEDLFVWRQGMSWPQVLLAQLTRRKGLEAHGAQVSVTFSPEPCEGFGWVLKK